MSEQPNELFPLLHIYTQSAEHGEAWIVGNITGLCQLSQAIDRAISQWCANKTKVTAAECAQVMVADGEHYSTIVLLNERSWQDSTWQQLRLPYTDERCQRESMSITPYEILGGERYRKLLTQEDKK